LIILLLFPNQLSEFLSFVSSLLDSRAAKVYQGDISRLIFEQMTVVFLLVFGGNLKEITAFAKSTGLFSGNGRLLPIFRLIG
jgi:hypothetical protein